MFVAVGRIWVFQQFIDVNVEISAAKYSAAVLSLYAEVVAQGLVVFVIIKPLFGCQVILLRKSV